MPPQDQPQDQLARWTVGVLGAIKVTGHTSENLPQKLSPTLQRIVAAVAASHPKPVDRVTLTNRVWDSIPDTSASSLRNFLVRLRAACPDLIEVKSDSIGFTVTTVELDAETAKLHIERADEARLRGDLTTEQSELDQANSLWYGETAYSNIDASWLVTPRDLLAIRRRDIVRRLVELLDGVGDDAGLERLLRPLVASEHVPSWMVSRLAEALARLAKPEEALSTLAQATAQLSEFGGAQPPSAWRLLAEDIWAGAIEPRRTTSPTNLPPVLRLSTEQFVGRHAELKLLLNPLAKSLLICGQSGAGKSFLVATALRSALDRAALDIVYVSCEASDQRPLECFSRVLAPDSATQLTITRVIDIIVTRSQLGPTLVVVDDVQWADSDTLRVVQRIAERHTSDSLGLICLGRPSDSLARLRNRPIFRPVIELGGLSGDDLHTFCEQRLGRSVAELPEGALEITGGFPLPLEMFVLGGGNALLAPFGSIEQDFLRCAALLGERVEVGLLSSIVDIPKKETTGIVLDLEAASLLSFQDGYVRFRHPLVQRAIIEAIAPAAKNQLHERIATCVVAPSWVRARHALQAFPLINGSVALAQAVSAKNETAALRRFGDQADLALAILESDQASLSLSETNTIELLLEAATATERSGRFGAEVLRRRALAAAEIAHDHRAALRIILEPSVQGRSVAMLIEKSWITRALALVKAAPTPQNPAPYDEDVIRLRSERLMRAGLSGGVDEMIEEVIWAQELQTRSDCPRRSEVLRALITSTIGSTDVDTRRELTNELFDLTQNGLPGSIEEDVRADTLSLYVRSEMETGNLADVQLASRQFDFVDEPHRNVDHWAAQAVRACLAAMSQNLGSAMALAHDAAVVGAANGISDALPVWMLQFSELLRFGAPPAAGVVDPVSTFQPDIGSQGEVAEPSRNAHAYLAAFSALSLARNGDFPQAHEAVRSAFEYHHAASTDLLMLPAAGLAIEACWLLSEGSPTITVPPEIIDLFRELGTAHVIVGATPVWSLGPASRFVAVAEVMRSPAGLHASLFSKVIEQCKLQGQPLWAAQTLNDFNRFG